MFASQITQCQFCYKRGTSCVGIQSKNYLDQERIQVCVREIGGDIDVEDCVVCNLCQSRLNFLYKLDWTCDVLRKERINLLAWFAAHRMGNSTQSVDPFTDVYPHAPYDVSILAYLLFQPLQPDIEKVEVEFSGETELYTEPLDQISMNIATGTIIENIMGQCNDDDDDSDNHGDDNNVYLPCLPTETTTGIVCADDGSGDGQNMNSNTQSDVFVPSVKSETSVSSDSDTGWTSAHIPYSACSNESAERAMVTDDASMAGGAPLISQTISAIGMENTLEMLAHDGDTKAKAEDSGDLNCNTSRTSKGAKPPPCVLCGNRYRTDSQLRQHMKGAHNRKKPHCCSVCKKTYTTKKTLKAHMGVHTGVSPFKCRQCGKCYADKRSFTKHLSIHKIRHYCIECDEIFSNSKDLRAHNQKHNSCSQCAMMFNKRYMLERHLKVSHNIGDYQLPIKPKRFSCEPCGKAFIQARSLRYHNERHHHHLISKKHMRIKKQKRFISVCEICGKSMWNTSIKTHMIRHTGTRSVNCPHCEKTFYTDVEMKEHIITHTEEKAYCCPQCGKMFKRKKVLANHMKMHSGNKEHECQTCGKCFPCGWSLVKHERIHTTVKTILCIECGKAFRDHGTMVRHWRCIHNHEKPHICQFCARAFTRPHYLKSHLAKMHANNE